MSKKSKESIVNSMMALLESNTFEELTIREICVHSDVVRRTFYYNFSSKEAVMDYIIIGLIEAYLETISDSNSYSSEMMSLKYFEFWYRHKKFLRILCDNNLFFLLQKQYNQTLPIVGKMIPSPKIQRIAEVNLGYIYSFYSAGLVNLLEMWIRDELCKTPEEMSQIFVTITMGV